MTIVIKRDGVWEPITGTVTLERTDTVYTTRTILYRDGRQEEEDCDPYPVRDMVDIGKVAALVAEGVWGEEELARYGLAAAEDDPVPEGKQRIGEPSYVEEDGTVRRVFELEDIPPPPPPPTRAEKVDAALALLGVTRDELMAELGLDGKKA